MSVLSPLLFLLPCRVYIPCIYILNKIDQISIEVGAFTTNVSLSTTSSSSYSSFPSSSSSSCSSSSSSSSPPPHAGTGHHISHSACGPYICSPQVEL